MRTSDVLGPRVRIVESLMEGNLPRLFVWDSGTHLISIDGIPVYLGGMLDHAGTVKGLSSPSLGCTQGRDPPP